jgi:hypothetical protein
MAVRQRLSGIVIPLRLHQRAVLIADQNVFCSMSRSGNVWDNAVIASGACMAKPAFVRGLPFDKQRPIVKV